MTRSNTKTWLTAFPVMGVIYVMLVVLRVALPSGQIVFGLGNLFIQLTLDLMGAGLGFLIYREQGKEGWPFLVLGLGFLLAAFTDTAYGVTLQLLSITDFHGHPLELVINIPFLGFFVSAIIALHRLAKNAGRPMWPAWMLAAAVLAGSLVFLGPLIAGQVIARQTRWLHYLSFFVDAPLIGLAAFLAFLGKLPEQRLIGAGFLLNASYGFLLQMVELFGALSTGLPIEFLWSSGLLSIVIGEAMVRSKRNGIVVDQ